MKDIGIIDIDSKGYIQRWCADDRSYISNFLPKGPGWIPEHYLSYVINFEDGGLTHPDMLIHIDGIKTNNYPTNIRIHPRWKEPYNDLGTPTDANLLEWEYVYTGMYQDSSMRVVKITRCLSCGIPVFDNYLHSDKDSCLCSECFWEQYDEEDEESVTSVINPKITSDDYPIKRNLLLDCERGYTPEQLKIKYHKFNIDPERDIPLKISTGNSNIKPFHLSRRNLNQYGIVNTVR